MIATLAPGWLLGCVALHLLPALPGRGTFSALFLAGALAFVLGWRRWREAPDAPDLRAHGLILLAAFLLAFSSSGWRSAVRLADRLPEALAERELAVEGYVRALGAADETGRRFAFAVDEAPAGVPSTLWLLAPAARNAPPFPDAFWQPGSRWRLRVTLRPPHGLADAGVFDREFFWFSRGIGATGRVTAPPTALPGTVWTPRVLLERWREAARQRLERTGARHGDWLGALAIGERGGFDDDTWQTIAATGTAHLVSISGLHVTLVALLAGGIAAALWRRDPARLLRLPARQVGLIAGVLAALAYAALSGLGIPTQRTVTMLMAAALAFASGRFVSSWSVLMLSLWAVLVFDPWAVGAPGFWLSFLAMGAIIVQGSPSTQDSLAPESASLEDSPPWYRSLLASGRDLVLLQWRMTLLLAPVVLGWFGNVAALGTLANLVAIPWVSWVVTPLALLVLVFPTGFFVGAFDASVAALEAVLRFCASIPGAMLSLPPPPWPVVLAATAAIAWALLPRGTPARALAVLAGFSLIFLWQPPRPGPGEARLTVLDVGQGLAVHVQTAAHDLVFDTGPRQGGFDAGSRVLVPYLRTQGVRRLDRVILSHPDNDHVGGWPALARAVPVASVRAGGMDESGLAALHPLALPCSRDDRWEWDGVRFAILHPDLADPWKGRGDNDASCVLRIETQTGAAIVSGDLSLRGERHLIATLPAQALRAEIIVAGHHGSKTSSAPEWIEATGARHVVYAVGYRNRFHHPACEVATAWRQAGARAWRSDRDGAITTFFGRNEPTVRAWRAQTQRYWYSLWQEPSCEEEHSP
ncbi:DNA internalization-related competence protein ComEC/Rec2 [Tepidiphilus baoligensis]|uniref:DNA internalization-related competence protein ComEC/Rec2 n=1 Tax=Tepidiphilus baoligensis TaxID=2698687 RepID=A0ABX1QL01_9PROT|nr:DNA internalization-related competence protein ComEC/Rec2 [Tepidiphilus baoligensis]NMH16562.1 DNA internalization-related competence protein ComEC/Rec2 [Tepidiphilus baoligensis]